MLASDADCLRASRDPAFRRALLSQHLKLLLGEINRLRRGTPDLEAAVRLRAGLDMAVKVAALLQK